jgi:hypothetical protein
MKTKKRGFSTKTLFALLIIALSLGLTFCFSDEEEEAVTTTTATTGPQAGALTLRVSQTSVKSDNSDSATITATVLDSTNAVMEGVTVLFSSTGGQFNSSSIVTTDTGGEAAIGFSSGADRSNQTVTITGTVSGLSPKTVPIQITGSTVTLTAGNTNLEVGGAAADTLTVAVKDAGGNPISGTDVTASIDTSSTGSATVSPATGTTDINGELDVTVTGTGSGTITVRVQVAGVTATKEYTVSATGIAFGISNPTTDPYSLKTDKSLTIEVNAPNQTAVQFATTLGYWDGVPGDMVVEKNVTGGTASAALRSANAGVATVQVTDVDDTSTTDTLKVAIYAPSTEASQIAIQASATVVAISSGSVSNSVTLTATVKNANDEPVGNAPVAFSIQNPTGGGESVSPVIAYTDSYGDASAAFLSGSSSSDALGVTVVATVVGTAINDTIAIVIGGTAGSVMIGIGSTILSTNNDTTYELPMSVIVADSNGNPLQGATVTLGLWPSHYSTGEWVEVEEGECRADIWGTFANEDLNRNLILDAGEDVNVDGELTPPSSAAGTVKSTVTTDENGVASFNLIYSKSSAAWIVDEIKASTMVLGTETQSTYSFRLGWLAGEECNLPHSPYNP